MTDNQYTGNKWGNMENKRNDLNRPKEHKGNKQTSQRFENSEGEPVE